MSALSKKLWNGCFKYETDSLMETFGASMSFDQRLYAADCIGSIAYCKVLTKAGIVTEEESVQIISGLQTILSEWKSNSFQIKPEDEDIHSANERRLGELVGSAAGKLHTGRSRNDQVVTDMKIWLCNETISIFNYLTELVSVAVCRANTEIDTLMPGYTHLQKAQPIRWSHFLLSHAWMWYADAERLKQLFERINVSPLGCGALAGHAFNIDLGFHGTVNNSLTAVGDRDFVAEFQFWASLTMLHISRIAEDLIIYLSSEYGFVKLADAYCTGSCLMPQKKNPDSLELLRGKCERVFGNMTGFMMTYKGLPSAYNKDLQEDKEALFDTVHTLSVSLQIATGVLRTMTIFPDKMCGDLSSDMLATALAEYLVRKGVPFRQAYFACGSAVKMAAEKNIPLHELSMDDLKLLHSSFDNDVIDVWSYENSVEMRDTAGGTSKSSVTAQINTLNSWLFCNKCVDHFKN